ncbi:hypothetical protein JK636_17375 [Clostridium sp. YIM B02515]|uniref:DUF4179 domain-containing protein n=1 Tax=Clostridium rhizosphaerae TaxID=2803861 RepID=A0ABS1TDP8_9CLOT|nr:hypothetical protein [Clostridium rhizosphaerae]MBL4937494.1 hypothetical protein [Clostridium rhizosphaerae]
MIWSVEKSGLIVTENESAAEDKLVKRSEKHKSFISRLKISKTLLICSILIGFISLGAGVGTYSWFVSSASSNVASITVGSFELRFDSDSSANAPIKMDNIEPGYISKDWTVVSFANAGTLDMILMGNLNIQSKKFGNDGNKVKAYKVISQIYKGDTLIYSSNEKSESYDEFTKNLNSKLQAIVFKKDEKLICKLKFILDKELATIEYQGDEATGDITIKAKQNVDGATF